ncbi:MAG: hypothetical protein H7X86_11500 [Gorillibacterium sp.]|nr:hypothetical protein [Gorillibacterium sp.]
MKRRNERYRLLWYRKKVAAGMISIIVALTVTMGIAYADVDLEGTLQSWFNKKTDIVMKSLEQSVQSETDKQKTLLKQQLQLRLEASSEQLDAYTAEQKRLHTEAIEQYAEALIENMEIDTEQDRKQILAKLEVIIESAKEAMDSLAESYVQPVLTFVPAETSTVTEAVYIH